MANRRNSETHARGNSARSKSMGPVRSCLVDNNNMEKTFVEKSSLEAYGYFFDRGKLVSLENGRPFQFNAYPHDEDNQKRYHAIGRLVDNYIYGLLENECHLRRIPIPVDARTGEPTSFFFASDNFLDAENLMIIIHGTGVVRAGQWSRKLIINENIQVGSQLAYIMKAQELGFAVIVTNTNLNIDESSRSIHQRPRFIRGSESPEDHGCYIWENFVRQSSARHICIVAHSYGGAVMLEMASRYTSDFDKRVLAVALTDSPMKAYIKRAHPNVLRILRKRTINWVGSKSKANTNLGDREYGQIRSAGHTSHEWTSFTSFLAVFQFIKSEFSQIQRYKNTT
ncbi:hypothetical protein I4U23_019061 [Adineta vaga]|nr:hypothetical protein I4U23_019061 [Adineta vaga]